MLMLLCMHVTSFLFLVWASIGVTRSYSSLLFLCALDASKTLLSSSLCFLDVTWHSPFPRPPSLLHFGAPLTLVSLLCHMFVIIQSQDLQSSDLCTGYTFMDYCYVHS